MATKAEIEAAMADRVLKLEAVVEAAGGLIEEIANQGTHTRWKETAEAIAALNATEAYD